MQQTVDVNSVTIKISDQYDISSSTYSVDATPYFNTIGSEYVVSFQNLEGVKEFVKFTYDTLGVTDNKYLKSFYRISRDELSWTDWLELKSDIDNFPIIDTKDLLFLDIKWIREGSNSVGTIRLLEYNIEGVVERNVVDGENTINLKPGESVIMKAPYIYKVFKITDIEIISSTGITGVDITYRFSQDNSRTWSNWEPFTKENITTVRINPIRFFQIEYSISNNSSSNMSIQDINLIGDFQNVSKDYFKSNLFGIRECCQSNLLGYIDSNGNFIPNSNMNSLSGGSSGACETTPSVSTSMTDEEKANLYNPYAQNTATNLLSKLSNDAQQIFGHKVIYFVTDPDKKGQDHTLNEYQLYNIACEGNVKISVEGNNFPDSQILMNQFDLNLFESMEVHITKQQFKEIFGPQRRPSKEDFLFFCDLNRMFQVDHAQQFRNFNNSAVYYKLILKKFTQKSNVQSGNQEIKNRLDQLTKNSTIDELFGLEQTQDKLSIANKDQFKPLTIDPIRLEFFAKIDKELIENSSNIISKSNYDLSSIRQGSVAVKYKNVNTVIKKSDNIGYIIWFNINNYILDENYNLFDFYDVDNNIGWKANLSNDKIRVNLNSDEYRFNLGIGDGVVSLDEEVWYCYVLNINQRLRKMEHYIYKRDVDYEEYASKLNSTILRNVYTYVNEYLIPIECEMENISAQILASDMKITNIRLFNEEIPSDTHNKILNQIVIRDDSKHLVFADSANTRLSLPNYTIGNL